MIFNTLEFLFFGIVFLLTFPWARRTAIIQHLALTLFSFVFYAYGDLNFLPLLLLIGTFNYWLAIMMARREGLHSPLLFLAVTVNLTFLIWGKLSLSQTGHLPLGISFYTFQAMSFIFDVYRRETQLPQNFWHYQAYLFFFPQLIAGPICRAGELLEEIRKPLPKPDRSMIRSGFYLLSFGLLKKAVIADALAFRIDPLFKHFGNVNDSYSWIIITLAYGWQIYFDFSGYTDMARGISKIIGVNIPLNFNHPYAASSLRDFWHRWHMTLSQWFRDYVYIPLGGSKKGSTHFVTAIFISFVLSAIWHGLGWNYVLWGIWHATFIVLMSKHSSRALTLTIVFTGWIFFRARDPGQLLHILQSLGNFTPISFKRFWGSYNDLIILTILAILAEISAFWFKRNYRQLRPILADSVWIAVTLFALIFQTPVQEFIYFRF